MSKYIIKNCPSYHTFYPDTGAEPFTACDTELPFKRCKDCTDCVMKQIVELCKRTCRMRCTNDCLGTKKYCGYGQILKLLDIQEVE